MFIVPLYAVLCYTVASVQKKKVNTFYLWCLRCILKLDSNKEYQRRSVETYWTHHYVLYPQTAQASLTWSYSENGRQANPKVSAVQWVGWRRRKRGRPALSFKDVCKRDLKILNVGTRDVAWLKIRSLVKNRDKAAKIFFLFKFKLKTFKRSFWAINIELNRYFHVKENKLLN